MSAFPFENLPHEIQHEILSWLCISAIGRIALVCRFCHSLTNEDLLWKHLCELRGFSQIKQDSHKVLNWKEAYRYHHRGLFDFFS